jgi:hypothetical protein
LGAQSCTNLLRTRANSIGEQKANASALDNRRIDVNILLCNEVNSVL